MTPPPANPEKCGNPKCPAAATAAPDPASPLQRCGRCKKAAYCSKDCQTAAWPQHKKTCRRLNYIIKFHLAPEHIKDPPVTRTLSCPADAVFYHLHLALQVAFGWATTHSFDFAVANPDYESPWGGGGGGELLALVEHMKRLSAAGGMPDQSAPQQYLFRVVDPVEQTMFSGIDRMHEGQRRHPHAPEVKADSYKLYQLFDDPKYQGKPIIYTYDFGDNWEHHLTITGRADATREFECLDGAGHGAAEDAGGPRGWEELKAAYRTARPDRDQREKREWFERRASNRDPRGLAGGRAGEWDRDGVNRELRGDLLGRFERMAEQNEAQLARLGIMNMGMGMGGRGGRGGPI